MDMTGERRIAAPRETVWQALNDPTVLKASIPGCESLEKLSDTDMKASASVKIGPIAARFNGAVHLTDIDPPNGYTIGGEGQGGVAGFAKGGAKVRLEPAGEATLLQYEVHAQVGGRIAQLGARLIDATAKQMADSFFDRFSAQVAAPAPEPETRDPETREPETREPETRQIYPAAPSEEVAHPVLPMRPPPSAVSVFSLIPPEPMGLPLAAWIGGAIYLIMLILILGSMA